MKNKIIVIFATVLGNIFESYDFIIFGFMLKYMQEVFLPSYQEESTKYILSFLLFSIGYLGRPIGAYILGRVGDLKGRRISIATSIIILTVSTCLIGFLPTYQQIGILAPILLIILRLVQNFSVSIEQVGGALFLIESFPKKQQYTVSSFMFGSIYLGHIIGLMLGLVLVTYLSFSEIVEWGWRLPFILALPLGCVTAYLRLKLAESPEFLRYKQIHKDSTFKKSDLFNAIASFLSLAVSAYLTVIYIPNMLHVGDMFTPAQIFIYASIVNVTVFGVAILCGIISDRKILDGKYLQKLGLLGNIAFALPIYLFLSYGSASYVLIAQGLAALLLGMQAGTILGSIYDCYGFSNRYLVINLGFNIAMTFFGGLSPFVVAYFTKAVHPIAPAIYIMLLSSISLFFVNKKFKALWHLRAETI